MSGEPFGEQISQSEFYYEQLLEDLAIKKRHDDAHERSHSSFDSNHDAFVQLCCHGNVSDVKVMLLENPHLIDQFDICYLTALMKVLKFRKLEKLPMVEFLISNHASINIKQPETGNTALHFACFSEQAFNCIDVLMRHGADPMIQNINGDTPLHTILSTCSSLDRTSYISALFDTVTIQGKYEILFIKNSMGNTLFHQLCLNDIIIASKWGLQFVDKILTTGFPLLTENNKHQNVIDITIKTLMNISIDIDREKDVSLLVEIIRQMIIQLDISQLNMLYDYILNGVDVEDLATQSGIQTFMIRIDIFMRIDRKYFESGDSEESSDEGKIVTIPMKVNIPSTSVMIDTLPIKIFYGRQVIIDAILPLDCPRNKLFKLLEEYASFIPEVINKKCCLQICRSPVIFEKESAGSNVRLMDQFLSETKLELIIVGKDWRYFPSWLNYISDLTTPIIPTNSTVKSVCEVVAPNTPRDDSGGAEEYNYSDDDYGDEYASMPENQKVDA